MSLTLRFLHSEGGTHCEPALSLAEGETLYFWTAGQLLLLAGNLENGGQLRLPGPNGDSTEGTLLLTMTTKNGRMFILPGTDFLVCPE